LPRPVVRVSYHLLEGFDLLLRTPRQGPSSPASIHIPIFHRSILCSSHGS
jgi:hypothetical protein